MKIIRMADEIISGIAKDKINPQRGAFSVNLSRNHGRPPKISFGGDYGKSIFLIDEIENVKQFENADPTNTKLKKKTEILQYTEWRITPYIPFCLSVSYLTSIPFSVLVYGSNYITFSMKSMVGEIELEMAIIRLLKY